MQCSVSQMLFCPWLLSLIWCFSHHAIAAWSEKISGKCRHQSRGRDRVKGLKDWRRGTLKENVCEVRLTLWLRAYSKSVCPVIHLTIGNRFSFRQEKMMQHIGCSRACFSLVWNGSGSEENWDSGTVILKKECWGSGTERSDKRFCAGVMLEKGVWGFRSEIGEEVWGSGSEIGERGLRG